MRASNLDIDSFTMPATREGVDRPVGRKEARLIEQAHELYHVRGLKISEIMYRLWQIPDSKMEDTMGNDYWHPPTAGQPSAFDRNRLLRIARLPLLLSWLKLDLKDMEIEENEGR